MISAARMGPSISTAAVCAIGGTLPNGSRSVSETNRVIFFWSWYYVTLIGAGIGGWVMFVGAFPPGWFVLLGVLGALPLAVAGWLFSRRARG